MIFHGPFRIFGATRVEMWPDLLRTDWRETSDTLQLWTQMVGKTRLTLVPPINHWWHSTLYLSARGLTTGPMPYKETEVEAEFDFIEHRLWLRESGGDVRWLSLAPRAVADFYNAYLREWASLGVDLRLYPVPSEVPAAIPFPEDHRHCAYDPAWAAAFWRALLRTGRVMAEFRSGFLGKVSPVHFFWGGFDLAVTRFSGRPAPLHPGGIPNLPDYVVQEAYSHEVSSTGFWPGTYAYPEPAFYSYAYPEPPGFKDAIVRPREAFYDRGLREFLLPYEAVRRSSAPSRRLLRFFDDTYRAAADLGKWNCAALERSSVECRPGQEEWMIQSCVHLEQARHRSHWATPSSHGCQECLQIGAKWVHLRLCLTCGHVGCCDDSPYRHATRHFHATTHPVIRSYEPGEEWGYCYPDELLMERLPAFPEEIASEHYAS